VDVDPRIDKHGDAFNEEKKKQQRSSIIVPVMSLKTLLKSIPPSIEILHLHTDMQGSDFAAVKSAGTAIKRVKSIQTEVHLANHTDYRMPDGASNHIDSWTPYMQALGYSLDSLHVMGGEGDAFWILK
jgi:hypothetical protein